MPNAMIQPARATPRNERKKKGLTIRRNSQASMMETPKTTDHTWDGGWTRNPQNLSASRQNKKTMTTTVSKTRKSRLQYRVECETYALMPPNLSNLSFEPPQKSVHFWFLDVCNG
jgi:hypothetical protein